MRDSIDRREFLKQGALAAAALGAGVGLQCGPRISETLLLPTERRFAKVKVSWDRVIRTSVGLRPARLSGFLVKQNGSGTRSSFTIMATGVTA